MTKLILLIAAQIFLLALNAASSSGEGGDFARTMDKRYLGLQRKDVLTHLRFYWQDSLTGPNPSAARIHQAVSNSSFFGLSTMMDDPLTIEESKNSTIIGRAQGIYTIASQGDISYMMVMNLAFKTGKYNGSTITILGRNTVLDKVREMPVVGGSGIFRFARGYVELRSKFADFNTGIATAEYNCYVLHYE